MSNRSVSQIPESQPASYFVQFRNQQKSPNQSQNESISSNQDQQLIKFESNKRKNSYSRSNSQQNDDSSSHKNSSFQDERDNESHKQLIKLIAQGSIHELREFLVQTTINLDECWDNGGFNALHLAAYKNSLISVQLLCSYYLQMEKIKQRDTYTIQGQLIITPEISLAQWVNLPAIGEESFTAMHFAAFNGNVQLMEFLIEKGADIQKIHKQSRTKVSLFHVAAQGDSPSALAFLKKTLENIEPNIVNKRDCKNATPLHWACYAGSESAVQYLLAWGANVNAQDSSGLTPLHNAVKSAEELKSARSVRLLLIKGAKRDVKDLLGRKPIDIATECKIQNIQREMISYLEEPNLMQKCMIQTPVQKVQRSKFSVIMFIVLFLSSFLFLQIFIFPGKNKQFSLNIYIEPQVSLRIKIMMILSFIISAIFFLFSWLTDPGFVQKSQYIDFLAIIPNFDPSNLCPECEIIKTKRCRHCNICNRCVERYDHHCPWINNCVGYNNHEYFYIYIISLQIYMLLVFFTLFMLLRQRIQSQITLTTLRNIDLLSAFISVLKGSSNVQYPTYYMTFNLLAIVLIMICIIFMVPLIILVCVQTKNMMSNETTSERFGRKKDQNVSNVQDLTQPENLQHGSSQFQDFPIPDRKNGPKELQYTRQIIDNCFQMAYGYQIETQEDLLQKKFTQNIN